MSVGRHAAERPAFDMTVAVPTPLEPSRARGWRLGECWLCDHDGKKPVTWVGPAKLLGVVGPQQAPMDACEDCLIRIRRRVIAYQHQRDR
jgi:hypothetical protein